MVNGNIQCEKKEEDSAWLCECVKKKKRLGPFMRLRELALGLWEDVTGVFNFHKMVHPRCMVLPGLLKLCGSVDQMCVKYNERALCQ